MNSRIPPQGAILIVDDEEGTTGLLVRLLEREGYRVHVASSGESALTALEPHPPDLVLLDVHLPGIDGFEVCRRIRGNALTRLTPVVMITGLHAREHRIEGIEAGADDFLTRPFDFEELRARVRSLLRIRRYTHDLESAESVILGLALNVEARDRHTDGHCQRLAAYSIALGEALGLPESDLAALHRGGYLHDVGKIAVPDAVLGKPTRLTEAELALMRQHPVVGERLCGAFRSFAPVRAIVRHHHERLDGQGYPDRLRGDDVPLLAQIVGIADAYDAMTTARPYRAAQPPEQAYSELTLDVERGARRADLVETFIALARRGALVPANRAQATPRGGYE